MRLDGNLWWEGDAFKWNGSGFGNGGAEFLGEGREWRWCIYVIDVKV